MFDLAQALNDFGDLFYVVFITLIVIGWNYL